MQNTLMKTPDYLFMQFRTMTPSLDQVCDVYYPHLSRAKRLEKARNMEFPFLCYRLDESQKSPYLVDIIDLAFVLEQRYKIQLNDFNNLTRSVLKSDQHL
ncbi:MULTISPECIES: pyocin activator PrtN family protein [unclassified Acinetobacter]|uniref:pyocin activator PrtN family protein n=1 Tax=unclassified Acinetobacter TaxID=196816 RepID=UPI001B79BDAC|nr:MULTISPECIES: pyocin activator PrtN family protein [unclassified Acinetobacter]MBP6151860.1 pyocin activator PrtN family protein [Candidatus Methylopumilus sp.]MCH7352447.1 pyocin activator PrtN family protein [Acinetobacter sp. NIPH 2023]MCH7359840.1 pyocin activator PrtN family protein [Acinetobacter sp. NIPH 2024]